MDFILHCRPGFEAESGEEFIALATARGLHAEASPGATGGWVLARVPDHASARRPPVRLSDLAFARQMIVDVRVGPVLAERDRATPLVAAAEEFGGGFSDVSIEHADGDAGKALSGFCRRFAPILRERAAAAGLLGDARGAPKLVVFFVDPASCLLGLTWPDTASAWPMGIPRLRFPAGAPSRSSLKLAEAFATLLDDRERAERLKPGLRAVDLGAAPGGWSWQLALLGLRVIAVDNGRMDPEVLGNGLVEHVRGDGFVYRSSRRVEWMVCDIVDKPARVAALVAKWLTRGDCRASIFNLKLPMKRRRENLEQCLDALKANLDQARLDYSLRVKQLYHDREEVTGCVLLHRPVRGVQAAAGAARARA